MKEICNCTSVDFWTVFQSIGTFLGAIGTLAAVIVALWQIQINKHKKLKLSFSYAYPEEEIGENKYICISVANIGNRKVILKEWGISINKKERISFIKKFIRDPIVLSFNPNFPCEINIEEEVSFIFPMKNFKEIIQIQIKNNSISPLSKHLTFFVKDSTGKSYTIKTKDTIKELLKD